MMSFAYAPKNLYRYARKTVEDGYGSVTEEFEKAVNPRWMTLVPMSASRSKQDYGFSDQVTYLIILNDCDEYQIGDRIGNATSILYEVLKVQNYMTNQQLEVRECRSTE